MPHVIYIGVTSTRKVALISHHLPSVLLRPQNQNHLVLLWSMSLQLLPYDLLFNIARDLDIDDVHNLQAVSSTFLFSVSFDRLLSNSFPLDLQILTFIYPYTTGISPASP